MAFKDNFISRKARNWEGDLFIGLILLVIGALATKLAGTSIFSTAGVCFVLWIVLVLIGQPDLPAKIIRACRHFEELDSKLGRLSYYGIVIVVLVGSVAFEAAHEFAVKYSWQTFASDLLDFDAKHMLQLYPPRPPGPPADFMQAQATFYSQFGLRLAQTCEELRTYEMVDSSGPNVANPYWTRWEFCSDTVTHGTGVVGFAQALGLAAHELPNFRPLLTGKFAIFVFVGSFAGYFIALTVRRAVALEWYRTKKIP
jgi:hypothetical protein